MPLTKILIFFFLREIISFGNLPRTAKYARSVAVRSKGIDHSCNDIGGTFLEAPLFLQSKPMPYDPAQCIRRFPVGLSTQKASIMAPIGK